MKYFTLFFLVFSLGAQAAPIKKADASTTSTEDGLQNSSGVTTDQMNPSPNPAPTTESELIENSTLTRRPVETGPAGKNIPGKDEIQSQEDALDYSTTPKVRPRKK